jgi:hypothetical protein
MKTFAFVLAAAALGMACGGATTTPLLDGGGGGDGGSGGDAGGGSDATPPPGGDAGPDCAKLLADLESKRQAAIQCCPTCNTLQCGQQIDGLCCPLTVTSGDSTAAKAYKLALEAVKSASCTVNCPAIACSTQPSNVCSNGGTCQQ